MKRKEFLKQIGGFGVCSCVVASVFAPAVAMADENKPTEKPKTPPEDWRVSFAQQRYARFLAALGPRVEPAVLNGALEEVGRYCASTADFVATYAGNPDGFLAHIREKWHAEATYDARRGTLALAFPAMKECPCALVRTGTTPATACQCSIGWQKYAFGTVFGRPVQVELKDSILRGGARCVFSINAGPAPAAA